jgi:2-phosphoglycerate kinase
MTDHKGKRLFITGIPTSGKSYLAKKLAEKMGGIVVSLDDFREDLAKDDKYKKFVNFYLDKDELEYYTKTSPEEQWRNFVSQSEGLWPAFLDKINEYKNETRLAIFESVNLLPQLIKKSFDGPVIVLIGKSYEETLKRNKEEPRWGATAELQELEAKSFFNVERPNYIAEAKKYGYPVFESADEAFEINLLE